jgi:hypothetical protein
MKTNTAVPALIASALLAATMFGMLFLATTIGGGEGAGKIQLLIGVLWFVYYPVVVVCAWLPTYLLLRIASRWKSSDYWVAIGVGCLCGLSLYVVWFGGAPSATPWSYKASSVLIGMAAAYGAVSVSVFRSFNGGKGWLPGLGSMLVLVAFGLIPFEPWETGATHREAAQRACREKSDLQSKGPIIAGGYMYRAVGSARYSVDFYTIGRALIKDGFDYVEVSDATKHWVLKDVVERSPGSGDHLRFYVAPLGAAACAAYEQEVQRQSMLVYLRDLGLPPNNCIAAERVDLAKSRYEVLELREESEPYPGARWQSSRLMIQDRTDNSVHSEVLYLTFHSGKRGSDVVCVKKSQDDLFFKVIGSERHAAGGSLHETVTVDRPSDFLERIGSQPRLLETKAPNQLVYEDWLWKSKRDVSSDGVVSFKPRREGGMYLQIARPNRLLQVLVRDGKELFERPALIATSEAGIYFMATKLKRLQADSSFTLFHYSFDGRPLSILDVDLSDLTRVSDIQAVSGFRIDPTTFEFTLVDAKKEVARLRILRENTYQVVLRQ